MALSAGRADSLCRKVTVLSPPPGNLAAGRESAANSITPEQEGINGIRFPIWLDENGNVLPLIARKRDKK